MNLLGQTKIPYALSLDVHRLVGVDDVEQGLSCNCICPSCSMRLEAIQGDIKKHHFRHHNKATDYCKYSYWVSIRDLAKQILRELNYIQCKNTPVDSKKSIKNTHEYYRFIILEEKKLHEKYGMDIFFTSNIGFLGIFFFTPEKRDKEIKALSYDGNYHMLEIDLTSVQNMQSYTIDALKKIIEDPDLKKFIFLSSSTNNIELQEKKEYARLYQSKSIMDMKDFRAMKINTILINSFEQNDFSAINVAKFYYIKMCEYFIDVEIDDNCKELDSNEIHFFYQCKGQYYGVAVIQNKHYIYQVIDDAIILIGKCFKKEKIIQILKAHEQKIREESIITIEHPRLFAF